MASLTFISNSLSSSTTGSSNLNLIHSRTPKPLTSPLTLSILHGSKKSSRGLSVITKGGPSSTSYIFAFVFPISLLAVTIFTSMKIADELDQKFLEELAVNQEILEAEGDDDCISSEEIPAVPRKRNRPKREVEASSK
ncbi:hypothetical protein ACH5RR_023316 [Cinchona calisaya]|uniref:High chlorophyll fluorescence 153 n=1 Tax=Cinchona calisaya TaxID=153742 RepID=A0ABD2ZBU8_9GENT